LSKHRAYLEKSLGWKVAPAAVAEDLATRFDRHFSQVVARVYARVLDAILPDALEPGPRVGHWRKEHVDLDARKYLFQNIMVGISKEDTAWQALEQAIRITQKEGGNLRGLHVVAGPEQLNNPETQALQSEFIRRCREAGIEGEIAVEVGSAARRICDRAHWADLIVGKLSYPPADQPLARFSSGFSTMIRRCSRPILAVPGRAAPLKRVLLAYNEHPKAQEALFVAAYLANTWSVPITILTVEEAEGYAAKVQSKAKAYLERHAVSATFCIEAGNVIATILNTAQRQQCDLLIIGGYQSFPLVEVVLGSVVDGILRETQIPVLICR
jgi:nucleotide-binding universal stress UspA family protein